MVAGTCKKRGTLRNAVPRLRTRWCSMLIAKAFRHLARRTSSLFAILAITALHPFTVSHAVSTSPATDAPAPTQASLSSDRPLQGRALWSSDDASQ